MISTNVCGLKRKYSDSPMNMLSLQSHHLELSTAATKSLSSLEEPILPLGLTGDSLTPLCAGFNEVEDATSSIWMTMETEDITSVSTGTPEQDHGFLPVRHGPNRLVRTTAVLSERLEGLHPFSYADEYP